jgi:hypothetical protein
MKRGVARSLALAVAAACLAGPARAQDGKVRDVGEKGIKIQGTVEGTDNRVEVARDGKRLRLAAKVYPVRLKGGAKYRIDMVSNDLDAFLILQDSAGKQLAFDDDGGGNLNAKLVFTPPADGTYKVCAASLRLVGAFTLTVAPEGAAQPKEPAKVSTEPQAAGAQPGAGKTGKVHIVGKGGLKLQGAVEETDKKVKVVVGEKMGDLPAKLYLVKLEAGTKYRLEMRSPEIDSFLVVQDQDGKQLAFDDDTGVGENKLDAQLDFTPPKTGTYKIYAAALPSGIVKNAGKFTLTIRPEGGGADKGEKGGKVQSVGPKGLKIEGSVAQTDDKVEVAVGDMRGKLPAKLYQVKLEAGKKYRMEMRSPAIDSFLVVQDQDGKQLAFDDDTGGGDNGLDAQLDFTPPKTGTYKVFAATLRKFGKFTLTIRAEGGGDEKKKDVRERPRDAAPLRGLTAAAPTVREVPVRAGRGRDLLAARE